MCFPPRFSVVAHEVRYRPHRTSLRLRMLCKDWRVSPIQRVELPSHVVTANFARVESGSRTVFAASAVAACIEHSHYGEPDHARPSSPECPATATPFGTELLLIRMRLGIPCRIREPAVSVIVFRNGLDADSHYPDQKVTMIQRRQIIDFPSPCIEFDREIALRGSNVGRYVLYLKNFEATNRLFQGWPGRIAKQCLKQGLFDAHDMTPIGEKALLPVKSMHSLSATVNFGCLFALKICPRIFQSIPLALFLKYFLGEQVLVRRKERIGISA